MPDGTTPPSGEDWSTEPEQPGPSWRRVERAVRGLAFLLVFGVVAGALVGLVGLRTRDVEARNDSLELRVTYAHVTRPGLSTPLEIDVGSVDGTPEWW